MYDLLQYVGTKQQVRVSRHTPCEPLLNGFLLDSSASLVLMHVFHDFMPDGYTVFRVEDVERFRSGPYERHWENMLRAEELLKGLDFADKLDLSSMRSAIESISERFEHLIIECEDDDEDVQDYYIGSLVSADFDCITFRHFDGYGYWEAEPSKIDINEITKVQFDTPYIRVFSKYLRCGPRPASLGEDD